ncbi:single-stranded DNA-binding protein [Nocardioides sp. Root140]|uniref:single-stranded DNA-binding protein n=1 Tax=Nocardioides sp. Root140 TaxID=1736460 RepID=UPI0006F98681|nr:single-stranded DNA-binding protein [Nocardioides sp. Root140]KQY61444.1 hypothetical protein ASD30_25640 [Nocardioides sp. Root140]
MPIIICFEGRLATEPELIKTPNTDTSVCEAVVMVNHRKKAGEEWVDADATRYEIKAWKRRAEALAARTIGDSIVVIGHVETTSWETDNGTKRYRDTVVVDAIGQTLTT